MAFLCGTSEDFFVKGSNVLRDYVREEELLPEALAEQKSEGSFFASICDPGIVSGNVAEDEDALVVHRGIKLKTFARKKQWFEKSCVLQPEGSTTCILPASIGCAVKIPLKSKEESKEEKHKANKKQSEEKSKAAAEKDAKDGAAGAPPATKKDAEWEAEESVTLCKLAHVSGNRDSENIWVMSYIMTDKALTRPTLYIVASNNEDPEAVTVYSTKLVSQKPYGSPGTFARFLVASDAKNARVSAYINGSLAGKIDLLEEGSDAKVMTKKKSDVAFPRLPQDSVTAESGAIVSFVEGFDGHVRDLTLWRFALDADLAKRTRGGVGFCAEDLRTDLERKDAIQTIDFHCDDHKLPKNVSLNLGEPQFCQVKHFEAKNREGKEWALSVAEKSVVRVTRAVQLKRPKLNAWTLVLDMMVEKLPEMQQAVLNCDVECASAAEVYISSDGRVRALGKTAGRKLAICKPMVWHRFVVVCRLDTTQKKSFLRVFIDGKPALVILGDEQLKPGGRYAMDSDFFLSGDANDKHKLPINVRRIQLWPSSLKPDQVRGFGDVLQPLSANIRPADLVGSLRLMGYPRHWCAKAIEEAGLSRKKASDWILANKPNLERDDKAREHEKKSFNLSLTGYPVSWCSRALSESDEDMAASLLWLLQRQQELAEKDKEMSEEEKAKGIEDDKKARRATLRYATEKPSGTQQLYRMLKSTSEPLDIELTTLIRREPAERVTTFDTTSSAMSGIRTVLRLDHRLHKTLCVMYARQAILTLLRNWPTDLPLKLDHIGSLDFVGKLIRLVDFTRIDDGLNIIRKPLMQILNEERRKIDGDGEEGAAEAAEGKGASLLDTKSGSEPASAVVFTKDAPLSQYLVSQGLYHLIKMCCDPKMDVEKVEKEEKVLTSYNASLVVWINHCFVELVEKFGMKRYGRSVLSKQVVNLIFKSIAVLTGRLRLSFVQLLTTLIRHDVDYDLEACNLLKDLLNRLYTEQRPSRSFSPFFQALLELLLIIEKKQETSMVSTNVAKALDEKNLEEAENDTATSDPRESGSVLGDDEDFERQDDETLDDNNGEDGDKSAADSSQAEPATEGAGSSAKAPASLSYEFKHESDLDRKGIVYFVGSRGGAERWENPGETGHVSLAYSSMDAKCLADDFEVFNRDPYALGFLTDPADPKPTFTMDFHQRRIVPSHYTLRHAALDKVNCMRNWRLEASDDGKLWVPLRIHVDDKKLEARGSSHTWTITLNPTLKGPFSKFRIVGTGNNSSGNSQLCLSGFEVYGQMTTPAYTPLSFNIFDASDDLELSADGENWVKSVGGEPVKKAKAAAKSGEKKTKIARRSFPDDARPTVVQSTKGRVLACKAVQSFSKGKHYFAFKILRLKPAEKVKKPSMTKKKAKTEVTVGIVPKDFNAAAARNTIGSQGGWGYSNIGQKLHGGKTMAYGGPFKTGDVIGIELDLDFKSIHFYRNNVSQGVAFTDVEGCSAYIPAVSLHMQGVQVQILGEMQQPKTRDPENWPWFTKVILTGRLMQSFVDRERHMLPWEFLKQVNVTMAAQGIGSAERTWPKGLKEEDVDEKAKLPKVEVRALTEYIVQDRERYASITKKKIKSKSVRVGYLHLLHDAKQFSLQADAQLVACVDRICDKKNLSANIAKFPAKAFEPGPHLMHYKLIEDCKTSDLQVRLLILQILNLKISNMLPMLNFSVKPGMSPLTDSVRALRTLIFWSTKSEMWSSALEATQTTGSFGTININRFRANKLRDKGKCDTKGKRSCFAQLFRQLNKREVANYRIAKGVRAWRTKFLGEGGIDAGGLYRELIYCLCKELQSQQLPLFILCPNGREQIGQNRDKWVPNPSSTSPLYLAMYEFLGKLMGLAIRTLSLLNLDLPSIVWKALIGAEIEVQDVIDIDRLSFKLIENMRSMEPRTVEFQAGFPVAKLKFNAGLRLSEEVPDLMLKKGMRIIAIQGDSVATKEDAEAKLQAISSSSGPWSVTFAGRVTPEQFNMAFSDTKFVIVGSDQKERELIPGGRRRALQWETRREFCDHIVAYRKSEFKQQCAAMRRGLACVVPYALLSLFTWNELEAQVCGRSQMNVDLLQKMTKYNGCSPSDRHIQYFWQIMRNRFDEFEKAKFLKFVWGRARLPVRAADFQTHFTINQLAASARNPDAFMPIGHTCFFSVDMPAYTNLDIMHKRLLYAITHCEAIDADYGPRSIQAVQDEDSDDD